MNSWSNHIPKAVGALGALFLIYSMYMFFRRPEIVVPPAVKLNKPVSPVATQTVTPPKYVGKSWESSNNATHSATGQPVVDRRQNRERLEKEQLEAKMVLPREYLKGAHLKMFLPDDMDYVKNKNEGMELLMAVHDGRPELFVAYGHQKMTPEQARHEIEDQMGFYGVNITTQDTASTRNLGAATTFSGKTKDGEEVQAQFFYNPATGMSHMVLMMGRELTRQPARTRQIFDSLDFER